MAMIVVLLDRDETRLRLGDHGEAPFIVDVSPIRSGVEDWHAIGFSDLMDAARYFWSLVGRPGSVDAEVAK